MGKMKNQTWQPRLCKVSRTFLEIVLYNILRPSIDACGFCSMLSNR